MMSFTARGGSITHADLKVPQSEQSTTSKDVNYGPELENVQIHGISSWKGPLKAAVLPSESPPNLHLFTKWLDTIFGLQS